MADILVVDDNRANREALASLLEIAGHRVRKAASARQALEGARAEPPELVVSDVLMPGMDGYVLARQLRADARTAHLPVIFYTAYFAGQDAQELAQAHGVARVLVKPSDNDVILRTVQEVLDERLHRPAATPAELGGEHLRIVVDQLLEKTSTLEAQQRRIERLNRTLETLSAVNALIVRVSERDDLLAEACRIAVERGGFGFAAIRLVDHDHVVSSGEGSKDPKIEQFPVPPTEAVCNDLEASAEAPGRAAALRRGFRAYAVLPLVFSGSPAGALLLYARNKDVFDEEEMRLLHELAGDIAFALHHVAQKARMDYLAYHDSLTDLPNRSLFVDRLGQALIAARREKRFAAAVFLDVERFRMVNESFGRRAGDDLLREVAVRLCAAASDEDTVARVGADHFAIAVPSCDKPSDIIHGLLARIGEAFSQPVMIDGVELRVVLKAGIAVFPNDGASTETLCANAETALNHAKPAARYLFYTPDMNARVAESLALEHRLRRAIHDGRLALHYQPKVDVRTGQLAGLEALIRWQDPELGAVPPSKFVSLMEETGMILVAGRWALKRAVEDILRWQAMGLDVPRTSVNVSAIQLRQKDFVESVLEAIAGFGRSKPLLDVEITESVLVDDIDETTRKLQTLRRAGVEISVDDFGTGYCSLSYLARLPVDVLKIDRSFVVRMRDAGYPRNIVAMIVSLAHTLGLKVIAEGVEDNEQVSLLRDLGCDQIQGYLVSRPVPPHEVEGLLRQSPFAGKAAAA
jgi:diguanylate cyclase (GGDEF)-like protein